MLSALAMTAVLIAAISTAALCASIMDTRTRHGHVRVRLEHRSGFFG